MKKVLLACLLLAFLFCAACGQQKEETAVPMPADGRDEAQIRLDPNDPLNSYLDLSQLDQATLAACTQTLDITSENNGVTATLRSVVGDAMTLYLTVDLTFPDPVDLSAPPVSDASSPWWHRTAGNSALRKYSTLYALHYLPATRTHPRQRGHPVPVKSLR